MSYIYHIRVLPAALAIFALLIGMSGPAACANETGVQSGFEEHRVEFQNHDVKLAGSLLFPRSEVPVPAVVFVHGAGRQTREPYREAGEYFASQGIAALTPPRSTKMNQVGDAEVQGVLSKKPCAMKNLGGMATEQSRQHFGFSSSSVFSRARPRVFGTV